MLLYLAIYQEKEGRGQMSYIEYQQFWELVWNGYL
nr:MAG TPA: hypothetical protein [Caudoviricetes sp.]